MDLYTGPEKRILVGDTASEEQSEGGIFHRSSAVAVGSYALWVLQCSSNIQVNCGVCPERPHDACQVYLDEIIVIHRTFQELNNLQKVF
jgi:hypothetical protein